MPTFKSTELTPDAPPAFLSDYPEDVKGWLKMNVNDWLFGDMFSRALARIVELEQQVSDLQSKEPS